LHISGLKVLSLDRQA